MERQQSTQVEVTVYTREKCAQCDATKRYMAKRAIAFAEVDLSDVPQKVEEFVQMGHMSAPVVQVGEEMWSGFRPDKISKIIL